MVGKPLFTQATFERLFTRMRQHMYLKMVTITILLEAHITSVWRWSWTFAAMCKDVRLEEVTAGKTPLTYGTFVRFIARVRHHVQIDLAACGEAFVAHLALVRSLSGVCARVNPQPVGVSKTLPAHTALVRSFARVHSHVFP